LRQGTEQILCWDENKMSFYHHAQKIGHLLGYRLLLGVLVILLSITTFVPAAYAWKPTMHVFLADEALRDALDDGKVSLYRIDYSTRRVLSKLGDYVVDPQILEALRSNPQQYRAGVLGPDAYPDILTGQQVIHPDAKETGIKAGSDAWLQYLWDRSFQSISTNAIKAFIIGYLTHAAGDMYGHTFINHFSGAPFVIQPPYGPENAIKHVVLEGYVDKRLDAQAFSSGFFNISIAGVEDFIYQTMIDARSGSPLDSELLMSGAGGTQFSIPRIYSTLRANLEREIPRLRKAASNCQWWNPTCSRVILNLRADYNQAWLEDIDLGLRAWVDVSHQVAQALFFNSSRKANTQQADTILEKYVTNHLLSMSGAPDFVGLTAGIINNIVEAITPEFLLAPIQQLKEDLLNTLLKAAIGMTKQELTAYLTNPEQYFDRVMASGKGVNTTLKTFNAEYLSISDRGYNNPSEAFNYLNVPAAYNTVTLSKLILLGADEVNRLLQDLGSAAQLSQPNIMLGFIRTLDGDNQWSNPSGQMALAQDCNTYRQVFMNMPGEKAGCSVAPPPPPIPSNDCLPYDTNALRLQNEGDRGWLLTDDRSRMLVLDNQQDAENALALAKRHTAQCFIGRNNRRPDRGNYIVAYWSGSSGALLPLSNPDCISYDPKGVQIQDEREQGWLLTDGRSRMLVLDNQQDAQGALELAQRHQRQCFIGRGNTRPDLKTYIVQYWE
jgi:hypothetical protein